MPEHELDLAAYLARIGCQAPVAASPQGLKSLHLGHTTHIPFENLEIHLGRPMPLNLDALQELLIVKRRGGYCFQMNKLFSAVLGAIGFEHSLLQARVRLHGPDVSPASHQLLEVRIDGESWLADVGFGAGGLREPIPMRKDHEHEQAGARFRLADAGELGMMLQRHDGAQWRDLYSFERKPCLPVDYEFANYYLSNAPESFFVQARMCMIYAEHGLTSLFNDTFRVHTRDGLHEQTLEDGPEYLAALEEHFGIVLGPGDSLRPLAKPGA